MSHRSQGKRLRHFTTSGSLAKLCDALLTPESYEVITSQVHEEVNLERKRKGLPPLDWTKARRLVTRQRKNS